MIKKERNKVKLVPNDNHTLYINGTRVDGVSRLSIDATTCEVTISFPAEIGVRECK